MMNWSTKNGKMWILGASLVKPNRFPILWIRDVARQRVKLCADPETDTFFSYGTCCDNECCFRLRYWVYPASIAGIGFIAGAFFALCFQCR
uniref:Uncharacterized protein n=1 Tax=Caenorhabditis japonica TaxID=281687 RepID=A0A8R1DGE4_CAEJA